MFECSECSNEGMRSREEKLEFKKELEARTLGFSIRVFKLLKALPKNSAMRVISYQLGKSASSIGANYREANRAESGDDFAHKVSIALKEASETHYWLQVLAGLYPEHAVICELGTEAEEFLKIFQTVNRTTRSSRK